VLLGPNICTENPRVLDDLSSWLTRDGVTNRIVTRRMILLVKGVLAPQVALESGISSPSAFGDNVLQLGNVFLMDAEKGAWGDLNLGRNLGEDYSGKKFVARN
jgi:hypothetical protein